VREVRIEYNLLHNLTLLAPLGGERLDGTVPVKWNASDPDNDTLTFGDNSTMFNINTVTGLIYFIPIQEDVGNNSVLIYVHDGHNSFDFDTVNFEDRASKMAFRVYPRMPH